MPLIHSIHIDMKSENKKSEDNRVMDEKVLKDMSRSELIALIMKLNRKSKPVKSIGQRKVKPKMNYNLEDFFDDDPFPDFNPIVTNDSLDKK